MHENKERKNRCDGDATRATLIEAAGRLFAERGFARTSAKDICAAAGVGAAAVNYHFNGRDGLYEAVVREAHDRLVDMRELESPENLSAPQRLHRLLARFIAAGGGGDWAVPLLVREIFSGDASAGPLPAVILPKKRVVERLMAETLGRAPEDPAVQRALALFFLPCVGLLLVPRELRAAILPALDADPEAFHRDFARWINAGLAELAKKEEGEKKGGEGIVASGGQGN